MNLVKVDAMLMDYENKTVIFDEILIDPNDVYKIIPGKCDPKIMMSTFCCVYLRYEGHHIHVMGEMNDVAYHLNLGPDDRIRTLELQIKLKNKIISNLRNEANQLREQIRTSNG